MQNKTEVAVFGSGCFWCTEAEFEQLKGVVSVVSGYAGGNVANPTYEQVSTGQTGHAEALKVEYNPSEISLEILLNVFFATHDATTVNRQGNDIGPQYRSIILCTTPGQKQTAEKFIADLNAGDYKEAPVVTEVRELHEFFPAEEYHQQYYRNNPNQGYCQFVIDPKVKKFRAKFAHLLKKI